jgi:hypothetical protein
VVLDEPLVAGAAVAGAVVAVAAGASGVAPAVAPGPALGVADGDGVAGRLAADCDEASEFPVAHVVKPNSAPASTAPTAALRRQ